MDTNYKMISSLLLAGVSTCGIARQPMQNPMEPVKERPNILVIVCEDISPYLGCYGDKVAVTPNLDSFAAQAILHTDTVSYTHLTLPTILLV